VGNKEKKTKEKLQPLSAKMRGLLGVGIAATVLVGTFACSALTTGKNMFSFVTTGNAMDRFSPETAQTSKTETEWFFYQAANCFYYDVEQKYTSYTMTYNCSLEYANWKQQTYTNAWREVEAQVDENYTMFTVTDEYAEALTYNRTVREFIVCKKGENAGRIWGRYCEADQSASDVELLAKEKWTEVSGSLTNVMGSAASLLQDAVYGNYDFLNGQFAFSMAKGNKSGNGYLKPGMTPTLSFSYETAGERYETGHHEWICSYLNATTVVLPQSFLKVIGGVA